MKIISVQSMSGGTGVTATAAELALAAADEGQRVLAVDSCPARGLWRVLTGTEFHYLEDVRQLFRRLAEARWALPEMPRCGLLCVPEGDRYYETAPKESGLAMGHMALAGAEAGALHHARLALADLAPHFDVMIADVRTKDWGLMQLFHDVSDEVHLMLRAGTGQDDSIASWRTSIDRPDTPSAGPLVITHTDRSHRVGSEDGFDDWLLNTSLIGLRRLRGAMPDGFKFDREEANAR